jgi:hypothetical protein
MRIRGGRGIQSLNRLFLQGPLYQKMGWLKDEGYGKILRELLVAALSLITIQAHYIWKS